MNRAGIVSSHLFAAVAHAVVLSVCLLFTAHPSLSLSVMSVSQIFFFDMQADVLLFFNCNRSFQTLNKKYCFNISFIRRTQQS